MKLTSLALSMSIALVAPRIASAQAAQEVVITAAPPPIQNEVQPPPPSAQHVWQRGHWWWNPQGAVYQWVPGHWVVPPQQGWVWQPAEWVNWQGSWRFVAGHWRAQNVAPVPALQLVQVRSAPPPPQNEVQPPAPSVGHVWVAGHWAWNGAQYVWNAGHWAPAPAGFRVWVPGHWYQNAGFWYFAPGHWANA